MVEIFGYSVATIPAISAIVYGVVELLKYFVFTKNEDWKKYIPVVSAVVGAAVSIVMFFICPSLIPASAWYGAIIIGGASGLSAVGINQIKKQSEKKDGEKGGY